MYFTIFGLVVFAGFAMMVREGLWANLIQTFAILLGGLTAFGLHQPLTVMLDERTGGSYTYLLDFVVLWFVFVLTVVLVKGLAGVFSKTRVRFKEPIDTVAGPLVGFAGAVLLASITMATFHAAPLSHDTMSGKLQYGETFNKVQSELAGTSSLSNPDIGWLRLAEAMLSPGRLGGANFSATLFVQTQGQHRKSFQSIEDSIVKRG